MSTYIYEIFPAGTIKIKDNMSYSGMQINCI